MKRKVKRKTKKKIQRIPAHYDSLDAPVFVWYKFHTTKDISWLLVKTRSITKRIGIALQAALNKMYNEYFTEFGYSAEFLKLKRKELEIALLRLEMIQSDSRANETWIQVAEMELSDLKGKEVKSDFLKSKITLEKHLKYQIDMQKTSIREYYTYLKNPN